ncbi:Uncharacterised protein [uncultured Blautia sp.]|nr:Uncharacterised protein [uncultured Blautia sp.]
MREICFSFTFQYGSINTRPVGSRRACSAAFTFQYGSINTSISLNSFKFLASLHSNMVLLILLSQEVSKILENIFTFQYGSINTSYAELP